MGKARKHTPEQIVNILRQIEVAVANGKTHPIASREAEITEQTYYSRVKVSWREAGPDRIANETGTAKRRVDKSGGRAERGRQCP